MLVFPTEVFVDIITGVLAEYVHLFITGSEEPTWHAIATLSSCSFMFRDITNGLLSNMLSIERSPDGSLVQNPCMLLRMLREFRVLSEEDPNLYLHEALYNARPPQSPLLALYREIFASAALRRRISASRSNLYILTSIANSATTGALPRRILNCKELCPESFVSRAIEAAVFEVAFSWWALLLSSSSFQFNEFIHARKAAISEKNDAALEAGYSGLSSCLSLLENSTPWHGHALGPIIGPTVPCRELLEITGMLKVMSTLMEMPQSHHDKQDCAARMAALQRRWELAA